MRTRFLVTVAATLISCAKPPTISIDELSEAALHANCERLMRCGMFAGVEACLVYFRVPPPDNRKPAIAAGKLELDGQRARQCEEALATVSCDMTSREARVPPAVCREMFRGHIVDGDPCSFDEECASDRCDLPICDEGVCCVGSCGVSRPPAQLGDICARSTDCVDGYCGTDQTCHPLDVLG